MKSHNLSIIMKKYNYRIARAVELPTLRGEWFGRAWNGISSVSIESFRPEGSDHQPRTECKLQYNSQGLYGIFKVQDNYVRCTETTFQADVFKDSCVELFLRPKADQGYFNFEFNCGGALLACYITDSTRVAGSFKEFICLTETDDEQIRRFHSLPKILEPEQAEPTIWYLEYFIPFKVLERYCGPMSEADNRSWTGNFYKCGDETSHPHWASWSPVERLDFHSPTNFGKLIFDG